MVGGGIINLCINILSARAIYHHHPAGPSYCGSAGASGHSALLGFKLLIDASLHHSGHDPFIDTVKISVISCSCLQCIGQPTAVQA